MRIITINLSQPQINSFQILIELGLIPSRSEGVRLAIYNQLLKRFGLSRDIDMAQNPPKVEGKPDFKDPTIAIKEIKKAMRALEEAKK